jgi:hypothetical protein
MRVGWRGRSRVDLRQERAFVPNTYSEIALSIQILAESMVSRTEYFAGKVVRRRDESRAAVRPAPPQSLERLRESSLQEIAKFGSRPELGNRF